MKAKLREWEESGYEFTLDWLLRSVNTVLTGEAKFSFLHDKSALDIEDGLTAVARRASRVPANTNPVCCDCFIVCLPLLYPGVKVSYGTIQQMLVEAEGRAARFNPQVSLGGVEAGALDEMFSQGEPVLAGVDLDSGYLFGLSLSATRGRGFRSRRLHGSPCASPRPWPGSPASSRRLSYAPIRTWATR